MTNTMVNRPSPTTSVVRRTTVEPGCIFLLCVLIVVTTISSTARLVVPFTDNGGDTQSEQQQIPPLQRSSLPLTLSTESRQLEVTSLQSSRTTTSISSSACPTTTSRKANQGLPPNKWLTRSSMTGHDDYAAAWWMSISRFETANVDGIRNPVAAALGPIRNAGQGGEDLRMTQDWLDFSVQHLSKWQKALGEVGNDLMSQKCRVYLKNQQSLSQLQHCPVHHDTYLNTTLAVLPFGVQSPSEAVKKVATDLLASTMASLIHHGIKRIVVVGYYNDDAIQTASAFQMLLQATDPIPSNELLIAKKFTVQQTELAYVQNLEAALFKVKGRPKKLVPVNIPREALTGLKNEFMGLSHSSKVTGSYLGTNRTIESFKNEFDFVYYTEPDQILTARLSDAFWQELNEGKVLVPHRLQPVPHEKDVPQKVQNQSGLLLNIPSLQDHPVVPLLDSTADACCDTPHEKIYGQKLCRDFWWLCGLGTPYKDDILNKTTITGSTNSGTSGTLPQFDKFQFMTMGEWGVDIVHLAGSEHGRHCTPKPQGRGTC